MNQGVEHHIEYRIILPDGAVRWVEGKGEVLLDESGKTDRKRAEREREQLLGREQEARAEAEAAKSSQG